MISIERIIIGSIDQEFRGGLLVIFLKWDYKVDA
jgi:hypothetical protein